MKKSISEWAQTVCLILEGKGKFGYLTGNMAKSAIDDPYFRQWTFESTLIIAWLVSSTEQLIGKPFMFLSLAKEVWEAVRDSTLRYETPLRSLG